MKTLTIELPDEVYERARQRAAELGTSLGQELVELVSHFATAPVSDEASSAAIAKSEVARLFAALDKARNTKPIGALRRDELYDRDVLR